MDDLVTMGFDSEKVQRVWDACGGNQEHNLVTVPPAPPFRTPSVLTRIFTVNHGIQSSPL